MKISAIIFVLLFIAVWLMHRPFDVHNCGNPGLVKLHEFLEIGVVVQFFIMLNEFLRSL